MQVSYAGKSAPLSDTERDYLERRLQRLARHFRSAREVVIHYREERGRHRLELSVDLDGTLLRAEGRAPTATAAVDEAVERAEERLRRLKDKLRRHRGRADAPTVAGVLAEETEEPANPAEPAPAVVRRKRLSVKPMSLEEATLQMDLLGHDFFAFLAAEDGAPQILYRRRDGDYGLLELDV